MMTKKPFFAALAAIGVLGGAACAQETDATEQEQMSAPDASEADLVGKTVYDAEGNQVGAIEEIAVGADGVEVAVIPVGTFLGLGSKKVAVPTSQLTANSDGSGYSIPMTADELAAAPEYEPEDALSDY